MANNKDRARISSSAHRDSLLDPLVRSLMGLFVRKRKGVLHTHGIGREKDHSAAPATFRGQRVVELFAREFLLCLVLIESRMRRQHPAMIQSESGPANLARIAGVSSTPALECPCNSRFTIVESCRRSCRSASMVVGRNIIRNKLLVIADCPRRT